MSKARGSQDTPPSPGEPAKIGERDDSARAEDGETGVHARDEPALAAQLRKPSHSRPIEEEEDVDVDFDDDDEDEDEDSAPDAKASDEGAQDRSGKLSKPAKLETPQWVSNLPPPGTPSCCARGGASSAPTRCTKTE